PDNSTTTDSSNSSSSSISSDGYTGADHQPQQSAAGEQLRLTLLDDDDRSSNSGESPRRHLRLRHHLQQHRRTAAISAQGGGLSELYKPRRDTESFCNCPRANGGGARSLTWIHCACGEELSASTVGDGGSRHDNSDADWSWAEPEAADCALSSCGRIVSFHPLFSRGTAAAVGNRPLIDGLHYWELKFVSPVYGTDIMAGVCSTGFEPRSHHSAFVSLLGLGPDSMGLSYNGYFQQNQQKREFCRPFGQGAIVGLLLDLWHGTLTYFLNRQCLGVAARGLKAPMYPAVCSTAAKSGVKLIRALSLPITLQALSCRALRHLIPDRLCVTEALTLPPGLVSLLTNNLPYLIWPAYRHNGPSARSTAAASTSNDDVEDDIDAESGTASVSKRRRLDEDDDAAGPGSALA
ncbi:hypothetical protein BOX15_Mlig026700g2, partial [Macrostomum lignano]